MKISMLTNVCEAINQLLIACDSANITNEEIQKLSEMDNEFAEHVDEISNLFTIKPIPTSTSTPKPETHFLKPEPNDFDKDTSYDGNYSTPITNDEVPIIEESNINDTPSKENIDKSNTDSVVKKRNPYKVKPNDYPDAMTFIENNKDAIANDIDSAYDRYADQTVNGCTKKTFLEIVDAIYPNIISSTEEAGDSIFVDSPYEGIRVNRLGDIQIYDEKKRIYYTPSMTLSTGYLTFSYKRKTYSVGRTVLSTFIGEQSRTYRVIYKDNNRRNCALSNLEWCITSSRNEGVSSNTIEILCKIIVELFEKNNTLRTIDIVSFAVNRKINISPKIINKLMNGKYKDISDKYFDYNKISIDHGNITIDKNKNADGFTDSLNNIITENNGDILSLVKLTKDLEYGKNLFLTKSKMNMVLGNNDFIIPIMYCLRNEDGNIRHPKDILKAIRNEFGKFFITLDFVSKVLFKEYLPEVTDIWFSKEEINN